MQVAREVASRDIRPVIIPGDAADKAMGTDEKQQLFITKKSDGIRSLVREKERERARATDGSARPSGAFEWPPREKRPTLPLCVRKKI